MLKRTGWGKTTTQTSIAYAHITTISHKSRTERSRTQSTMAAATAQPDTPGKIDLWGQQRTPRCDADALQPYGGGLRGIAIH